MLVNLTVHLQNMSRVVLLRWLFKGIDIRVDGLRSLDAMRYRWSTYVVTALEHHERGRLVTDHGRRVV